MNIPTHRPFDLRTLFCLLVLSAAALFLTACGEESPQDNTCTPGFLGCACIDGTACFPGSEWLCIDGACAEPTCEAGSESCTCYANNTCDNDALGEPMLCENGTCTRPPCVTGSIGCDCTDGGGCESGLECAVLGGEELCTPRDCEIGLEGCPCDDGRACDGGLICYKNACVTPGCIPGEEDCFCRTDLGCDEGLQCDGDSERCEPIPCTPGATGCACDGSACTASDAACDADGICQQADCLAGQEGCACLNGESCGTTALGQTLFCEDGLCRSSDCVPGEAGCACEDGVNCEGDLLCQSGSCIPADCVPGAESCPCLGGACHPGLRCREDGLCDDATGFVNGPCTERGTCNRGARCGSEDRCVRCTLGSPGCGCDDADGCLPGAQCIAGLCISETNLPPAEAYTPTCYSHCESNLSVDGDTVVCDAFGQMPVCLGGRACQGSTCLFENEPMPTCESEFDCPEWQTCNDGLCASECDTNAHCSSGKSCFKHLCRVPCNLTNPCPVGQTCETVDAENGFCLPMLPAGANDNSGSVLGTFEMSQTSLSFDNTAVSGRFSIINNSEVFRTFEIRKRSDVVQREDGTSVRSVRRADGQIEVDDCTDPENDETCTCALDGDLRPDLNDCWCTGSDCFCTEDSDCRENGDRCAEGTCRPSQCIGDTCPMSWLELGTRTEAPTAVESMEVGIEPGGSATVLIDAAADVQGVSWQGTLEVRERELGAQQLNLLYTELPEGQWAGEMVYLAQFGTAGLDEWRVDQTTRDSDLIDDVGNAMLQIWGTFRNGRLELDELKAMFNATRTGSWQNANVVNDCEAAACYMYDANRSGLVTFSNSLAARPVPTGVVELPIAMNLHQPDPEGNPGLLSGRIESSKTLQYAGNPAIDLNFATSPADCDLEGGVCVAFVDTMQSEILVGGRYLTDPADTGCAARGDGSYAQSGTPWLVPGFKKDTELDGESGLRYRYECRDTLLPFGSDDPEEQALFASANTGLALSNPIPDGRARKRTLTLIDGAMINKSQLVLLFEEKFESFLGASDEEGFSAYGFMILKRRATDLNDEDANGNDVRDVYEGAVASDERTEPENLLAPTCSDDILEAVLGSTELSAGNLVEVVTAVIDGVPAGSNPATIDANGFEQIHYFCEDTGLIDGGAQNRTPNFADNLVPNDNSCGGTFARNGVCEDGGARSEFGVCGLGTDLADCGRRQNDDFDVREACPVASNVTFFTLDRRRVSQADIAALPCQSNGEGCLEQVEQWRGTPNMIQFKPVFRCEDPSRVYCDDNRRDLRDGKAFYANGETEAVFTPLQTLIDEAFRYKTRFQNRQGQGIGFAPDICIEGSNAVPYCYDPAQIEEIEARVDCLLHIHQDFYGDLSGSPARLAARDRLDSYLQVNFATEEERLDYLPLPIVHDGFERQYAQLVIMQGDESFTRAFASRFDLAGTNASAFEGALLEEGGINLSGAVGFEMFSLYQATQYYQMVLDRFFTHSPVMWDAIDGSVGSNLPEGHNFVTQDTVISYLDRVVRASTQKSRAWGEIARRYQNLGRPDLARAVSERAYTATYLESIVMSRMMLDIVTVSLQEQRDQIRLAVEDAQRRYKSSLLEMQDIHAAIEDNITIFGFEPDFIPFPAMDNNDFRQSNAFEVILQRTRNKMATAREREDTALAQSREFETNQSQFQSELTSIRNNFENQLGDICGTFTGPDDRIYPAIKKYAHLTDLTTVLGEPCGLVGNGQIHQTLAGFEDFNLEAQALKIQHENVLAEVEIERSRVSGQCRELLEAADFLYGKCERSALGEFIDGLNPFGNPDETGCIQAQINDLQTDIRNNQFAISRLQQVQSVAATMSGLATCGADIVNCAQSAAAAVGFLAITATTEVGVGVLEIGINEREQDIADLDRFKMQWQTQNECDLAKVESQARVQTTLLRLKELDLETFRLEHRVRLNMSELQRLRNLAKRLEAEQAETEQLTINVQAAHNNPNVRIYKNDAIINAEIAFDAALKEIYKLTRVFEYYTSTSYANKADLFQVRMVARGDKNLENYLSELEEAFFEFEEFFGHPSPRVLLVSLKNDVFNIPYTDEHGRPIDDGERTRMLRERLTDRSLLDKRGYMTIPFSTNLESLSPLTRNHKILRIQADMYGNDLGDTLGRIYLRQKGTAVINSVESEKQFHRFDERTAVINTLFSNTPFFDASIYQDFRLRDRPLVNTHWEMIINQRDEEVNQDWNLNSLTDIRLYIYYTDFTVF